MVGEAWPPECEVAGDIEPTVRKSKKAQESGATLRNLHHNDPFLSQSFTSRLMSSLGPSVQNMSLWEIFHIKMAITGYTISSFDFLNLSFI